MFMVIPPHLRSGTVDKSSVTKAEIQFNAESNALKNYEVEETDENSEMNDKAELAVVEQPQDQITEVLKKDSKTKS